VQLGMWIHDHLERKGLAGLAGFGSTLKLSIVGGPDMQNTLDPYALLSILIRSGMK
jgi:hypothetical protein